MEQNSSFLSLKCIPVTGDLDQYKYTTSKFADKMPPCKTNYYCINLVMNIKDKILHPHGNCGPIGQTWFHCYPWPSAGDSLMTNINKYYSYWTEVHST